MIDRDGVTERVFAERCVYDPRRKDAPLESTSSLGDFADKVIADAQYGFDRLLNHRAIEDGTTEFLFKWVD